MAIDFRRLAVAIGGFSTFLHLYAPQALLPELAREFGVGAAQISALITASTLAIALTAPFTGALADVLGRKRLITAAMFAVTVPMVMVTISTDVGTIIAWRFIQGLLLSPIFIVVLAYIGDEWPAAEVAGVAGLYVSGSSLGSICGRFIPGVLADLVGWRFALLALAGLGLGGAMLVAMKLPRECHFVRSEGFLVSGLRMLRHLRNLRLVAICAVGFGVLFDLVAIFTYVTFHLAAPPYNFFAVSVGGAVFHLPGRHCTDAVDRTSCTAVRAAHLHDRRDCHLDGGPCASPGVASAGDPAGPFLVRRLRDVVPGDHDRIRGGDRPRGALIRDRPL
jgi:MFS transporter, YNFM family, putative membrane transport protein